MAEDRATWMYAITCDPDPALLKRLNGIGSEPVRTVRGAGLAAVTGSVDAVAFGEEALGRRLSDPAELEAIARAHHSVIEVIAAARPTLPFRFATVYRDDDRVRALLAQRSAEFAQTLDWLAGRTECGVKIWADPALLSTADAQHQARPAIPPGDGAAASPDGLPGRGGGAGTAYLLRRRANLTARADGWQRAAARGDEAHAALGGLAVAARRHAPQDPRLAAAEGWMVLNGAYLVDSTRVQDFTAAAEVMISGLAGFRLDVTGPWPPYSFTDGLDD